MTKVIGISIVRSGPDLNEPIPVVMASDLASFGYFQRQVRPCHCTFIQTPRNIWHCIVHGILSFSFNKIDVLF
jgi:hypothetical protein